VRQSRSFLIERHCLNRIIGCELNDRRLFIKELLDHCPCVRNLLGLMPAAWNVSRHIASLSSSIVTEPRVFSSCFRSTRFSSSLDELFCTPEATNTIRRYPGTISNISLVNFCLRSKMFKLVKRPPLGSGGISITIVAC
jgi:hypothetical protein